MVVAPAVLSVIVPCLDEAAGLPELVARVGRVLDAQLPPELDAELVLVDDGSRDATWERMSALRAEHPWIRLARHARRAGIPAAWRTGLAHASGAWVCVLDADLQYGRPRRLTRMRTSPRRFPGSGGSKPERAPTSSRAPARSASGHATFDSCCRAG